MELGKHKKFSLEAFYGGSEYRAYDFFGCHKSGEGRYTFRVWAPRAVKTELVLNNRPAPMNKIDEGVFEVNADARAGDKYCYKIYTADSRVLLKADPYAFLSDLPESFYSVVCELPIPSDYPGLFIKSEGERPVNIYEVNLLSWKKHKDGSYLTYDELAAQLVPYVVELGYTHVEFMPVTEYPFDGSWGYQVTGYFSIVSRLGGAESFKNLIDAFHKNGIKVIVDWVPAHFPKDDWGLYEFDGQPLYECPLWDRMEHSGWGTRRFDFGRGEVDSFLLSSAYFLFDIYRIDGLRVDAVASMIYLDYDRNPGDFEPNELGDNRNLQAIEFLKKFNTIIKTDFEGAVTIAEESTTYPNLTKNVEEGGIGFDYKWNMGWMNDVLFYCRQDPYFRCWHHDKLTFSLVYAFSERFILPISHDEVVHVKGSVVNKMPGSYEDKFAGERLLLGYMFAHPGKKMNFMGYEIAQFAEWDYRKGIDFFLKKYEKHRKMFSYVKAINHFYSQCRPLYEIENSWDGFKWLVVDDKASNLLAFERYGLNCDALTCVFNFSGVDLFSYPIKVSGEKYGIAFNSDAKAYGGEGKLKKRIFKVVKQQGSQEGFLEIDIPKLTCLYLKKEK